MYYTKKQVWIFVIVPGGQKVGPDVECLIGQLEEAEDAVGGRATGVAVAGDDAVFMEYLWRQNTRFRMDHCYAWLTEKHYICNAFGVDAFILVNL